MRKPAFCIFCGLCILTSFSLLTVNVRGVSNKHCLLPFFHCAIYCCATADILTKLLQQFFLFFIVVVIPGHNLGNSQVSVYRTIGPTLV